jgi:hypothetical protein
MLKLDNNLLQEIGLGGLPEDQKKAMLQHIYETLELRVGTNLANQMTDAQLQEFERFIDAGGDNNQAEALKWLETNLPNYKDVVQQVFTQLKGEIAQMAPQIMASTQQQAAAPVPGPAPMAQPADQSVYAQQSPQQPTPQPAQPYEQPQPMQQPYPQPAPMTNPGMAGQPQFSQPFGQPQPVSPQPAPTPNPMSAPQTAYQQPQPMQQQPQTPQQPQPMPPQWQPPLPPATPAQGDQTQQPPQAA